MKQITILPVWLTISKIIAMLVLISSLMGLLVPSTYSQENLNWTTQAYGQDISNLVAVAVLLLAVKGVANHSVKAYLVWLGVLLYTIYAFVIYAFFIHFNPLFLVYTGILGLSVFTLIGGLYGLDIAEIGKRLFGNAHAKTASRVVFSIGALFTLLWLADVIPASIRNEVPKSTKDAGLWVNPVHVID